MSDLLDVCKAILTLPPVVTSDATDRLRRAAPDLLAACWEALEFVEAYEDVVDGDYGIPEPNRAMRLAGMLRDALILAGERP